MLALSSPVIGGLALAQIDLTGEWARVSENERDPASVGGQPETSGASGGGDYRNEGSSDERPLNDAARLAAASNPGRHSRFEDQCLMYPPEFLMTGSFPRSILIWTEVDPETGETTSWHFRGDRMAERVIWMDGRSHPSAYAQHTAGGYSTGRWEGDVLMVQTTHLKWYWEERSNVPYSDMRALAERFERDGDMLTHTIVTHDPVYLKGPMTQKREFRLRDEPEGLPDQRCSMALELAAQPRGYVPHYLPGTAPNID